MSDTTQAPAAVPVGAVYGGSSGGVFQLDKPGMQLTAIGACVLASGGGGSYTVSTKIIEQGVPEGSVVNAWPISAVGSDQWVAVSANMGSPGALFHTTNPYAPTNAFSSLQAWCRVNTGGFERFVATLPVEVGAINSASPLAVAAQLNIPILDADGAGRSIPTLPLTTYARRFPVFPNYVASEAPPGERYNTGQIDVPDETAAEDAIIGLVMTPPFGGIAGLAIYPMPGAQLHGAPPVTGTLYDAWRIGQIVDANTGIARAQGVVQYLTTERPDGPRPARIVFYGKVVEMVQATGGTDIGYIVLRDDTTGESLWIYNQNENIFATLDSSTGGPLVMGPDSMCYLPESGIVFDNSDLWNMYQQDKNAIPPTYIVAIGAPDVVTADDGLMVAWQAERAQFGYSGPYTQNWLNG